MGTADI